MRGFSILSFFLALSIMAGTAFAAPQIAPELNFSNGEMYRAWFQQKDRTDTANPTGLLYQKRFADEVQNRCMVCTVAEMTDRYGERKFRVTMPSGFYFDITLDPSVIEITSRPLTESEMQTLAPDLQSLMWAAATSIGLQVAANMPGHLNFGIESTFGHDALLFHNFVVDYLNHLNLVQSTLGYRGYENAPHPEQLQAAQAQELARILASFDPSKDSIRDLATAI